MTQRQVWPRVFRTSPWMYALLAVAQAMFTAGAIFFRGRPDDRVAWLAFVGFAVFGVVALAEAATARVVLGETELEIVSNFRRRRYDRAGFVRVVGEKGSRSRSSAARGAGSSCRRSAAGHTPTPSGPG